MEVPKRHRGKRGNGALALSCFFNRGAVSWKEKGRLVRERLRDEKRMVTRLICEGSWRREYAAGSCGKEEKKKQNKTAGALWFVNVAAVFGKATSRGEENKSEGGASGELPAVVGEKPKTSGGGCV